MPCAEVGEERGHRECPVQLAVCSLQLAVRRYIGVLCPIGAKDRVSGLMWIAPHEDAVGFDVWGREVKIYSSSNVETLTAPTSDVWGREVKYILPAPFKS